MPVSRPAGESAAARGSRLRPLARRERSTILQSFLQNSSQVALRRAKVVALHSSRPRKHGTCLRSRQQVARCVRREGQPRRSLPMGMGEAARRAFPLAAPAPRPFRSRSRSPCHLAIQLTCSTSALCLPGGGRTGSPVRPPAALPMIRSRANTIESHQVVSNLKTL